MTVALDKISLKELYEIDDYLWLEETINLLKQKRLNDLDLENLIEELESLGSEKKYKVKSLLEQIIRHLLLLQYWESEYERNVNHWEAEVTGFRSQLNDRITSNFYNYLENNLSSIYQNALGYVTRKSRLNNLPQECPYTLEQLLDKNWFPENKFQI